LLASRNETKKRKGHTINGTVNRACRRHVEHVCRVRVPESAAKREETPRTRVWGEGGVGGEKEAPHVLAFGARVRVGEREGVGGKKSPHARVWGESGGGQWVGHERRTGHFRGWPSAGCTQSEASGVDFFSEVLTVDFSRHEKFSLSRTVLHHHPPRTHPDRLGWDVPMQYAHTPPRMPPAQSATTDNESETVNLHNEDKYFFLLFMYLANGFLGRRRLMRWLGATPPASFAPYGNDDDTSRAGSGSPLLDYDPLRARKGCTTRHRRRHIRMYRRGPHWRRLSCTGSCWR
jgi:hypothetical protein